MSANENESLDVRIDRIFASRRSGLIDFEETNRMERPSRVFSSRHHVAIPQVLTGANNMDQNETSFRRGSSSGDNQRTRSPFVRFTITDRETQRITATGQIPLSPPPISQMNPPSTSTEVADTPVNEESEDEHFIIRRIEQRSVRNQINAVMNEVNEHQLRHNRSGRRRRRFTEHPYFIRNNLDTTPSNRIHNRRSVRFQYNLINNSLDRSQTPEQELPEVLEDLMEPGNEEYEEVYHGQESSLSSVSSNNDADSDDDTRRDGDAGGDDGRRSTNLLVSENPSSIAEEEHLLVSDVLNDTPRTRDVPFIFSPIPLASPSDSPINLEMPPISVNNSVDHDDDNLDPPFRQDHLPSVSPFRHAVQPDTQNQFLLRLTDLYLNSTVNNTNDTNSSNVNSHETIDLTNVDLNRIPLPRIGNHVSLAPVEDQPEETPPVRVEEHPETYDDLNEQLTRLFECPVCFEHIVPPVYQCFLGHLICNKCVLMCDNCPTCRNPFNSKRNLYMEKVGYLVKFPCRNTLTGCKQQLFITQKQIHEQECCYRHYQCFINHCAWKGYYPELQVHMTNNHHNFILHGPVQPIDIMLPGINQTFKWFLVAHNELFAVIAHVSVPPRRVKIQVNFIGPTVKAKQFKFTIILTEQDHGGSVSSQKLTYERLTLPYSEIYEMSNNNGLKKDIFSLSGELLEPFIKFKRRRLPVILKIDPVGL